jgi:hypothetical protein
MIRLVSSDGDKVELDDFRKIGRGRILPLAGMRVPDSKIKKKEILLKNVKESRLG